MELNTLTHQVIALAGIAQAAALVQQLATTGKADELAHLTCVPYFRVCVRFQCRTLHGF